MSTPVAQKVNTDYSDFMTKLQKTVIDLVRQHGSYRAAGKALNINYAYLCRLATGVKVNPTPEVLAKLGIEKRISYWGKT